MREFMAICNGKDKKYKISEEYYAEILKDLNEKEKAGA
jgi:hypothetical protein